MKFTTKNGYMTLKIALPPTEITRTIVVPECMTLEDLNDAIQCVMGWEHDHLWSFEDGRNGPIYELPNEDGDFGGFGRRFTFDASKTTLGKAFPKRGAKLTYEYDFGDSWDHTVTRLVDPKEPGIACVESEGPDGIEDFGGQYQLAEFIEAMRENPKDEEWADVMEWGGFDDPEYLKEYLEGESAAEKTAKLRKELDRLDIVVPSEDEKPKRMSVEEQAETLGRLFATMVSAEVWQVLRDALQHEGKCEFVDDDRTISAYLLTMFDGLKIKDGIRSPFHTNPSKLTVPKKWVTWYGKHGKDWEAFREQFDIMESYAASAVHLYGALKASEFYDIMLRYDPGVKMSLDEIMRYLEARALWLGIDYRIEGDVLVENHAFAAGHEDTEKDLRDLLKSQKDFPRWYPADRKELFKWLNPWVFEHSPEVDRVELVLRSLGHFKGDELEATMEAIHGLIADGVPPDGIYQSLVQAELIERISTKPRQALLDALDRWAETIHIQCLNGNTIRDMRALAQAKAAEPKISRNAPCPCGSGKKYKMCCGKDK